MTLEGYFIYIGEELNSIPGFVALAILVVFIGIVYFKTKGDRNGKAQKKS